MEPAKIIHPVRMAHNGILNRSPEDMHKMEPATIKAHPKIQAAGLAHAMRLMAARSTRWKTGNPSAPRSMYVVFIMGKLCHTRDCFGRFIVLEQCSS